MMVVIIPALWLFSVLMSPLNTPDISDKSYVTNIVSTFSNNVRACNQNFVTPKIIHTANPLHGMYEYPDNVLTIAFWEAMPDSARRWYTQRIMPIRKRFPSAKIERQRWLTWIIAHEMSHAVQGQSQLFKVMTPMQSETGANRLAMEWYRATNPTDLQSLMSDAIDLTAPSDTPEPNLDNRSEIEWFNRNFAIGNFEDGNFVSKYAGYQKAMIRYVGSHKGKMNFCEYVNSWYEIGAMVSNPKNLPK